MRDYQRTEFREDDRNVERRPRRLSDRGRQAMQGLGDRETAEGETPKRYLDAAQKGAAEHPDPWAKAQGRAGERVALQAIEDEAGTAVDLNDTPAANAAIYDVAGPHDVASVKVRGLGDGARLKESTLGQYRKDFAEAIGRGSGEVEPTVLGKETTAPHGLRKFNQAARELHRRAQTAPEGLPTELAPGPDEAADYLRREAKLMIPDDHARQLRDDLREKLLSEDEITRDVYASNLGLDVHHEAYDEKVEALLGRIKGLPIQSHEIRQSVEHRKEHP
ncbi:MAG: hypothetical protein ACP5HM_03235 [Anaerolineae bacterium]